MPHLAESTCSAAASSSPHDHQKSPRAASLALNGRRFDAWTEIKEAVRRATEYGNENKHPLV
jgi:hypothetical protein